MYVFPRTRLAFAALISCAALHTAHAQLPRPIPISPAPATHRYPTPSLLNDDDRSGPRVGVAYIIGGSTTAEMLGKDVTPLITLFGWQVEHQFQTGVKDSPVPMTELVLLAGGIEQGVLLPSASWMLGLRQPNGWEFGAGPTLTGAGLQLAFAGGMTHSFGNLNVPVNLAVAPGRKGAAVSVTTGFNMR